MMGEILKMFLGIGHNTSVMVSLVISGVENLKAVIKDSLTFTAILFSYQFTLALVSFVFHVFFPRLACDLMLTKINLLLSFERCR